MESKDILYSDLKSNLEAVNMPTTLIFCGGSAYCKDIKKTVYEVLIPRIEGLLRKDRTAYEVQEMKLTKDRLYQIYVALQDKNNWDIDLDIWNERNKFSSFKLEVSK